MIRDEVLDGHYRCSDVHQLKDECEQVCIECPPRVTRGIHRDGSAVGQAMAIKCRR